MTIIVSAMIASRAGTLREQKSVAQPLADSVAFHPKDVCDRKTERCGPFGTH
jgi:hypothetical protein